jgi:quinol monooxygenase YgiN
LYVVTVEFLVHSEHWVEFLKAMVHNAQTSLQVEPGCKQFDVCESAPGECKVFLYELYDSSEAFAVHLKTAHFLDFNAKCAIWVKDKKVQTYHRVEASANATTSRGI